MSRALDFAFVVARRFVVVPSGLVPPRFHHTPNVLGPMKRIRLVKEFSSKLASRSEEIDENPGPAGSKIWVVPKHAPKFVTVPLNVFASYIDCPHLPP